MKSENLFGSLAFATTLCVLNIGMVSCRKSAEEIESTTQVKSSNKFAKELSVNRLGSIPGGVYQNQAKSPLHWQPWTHESFKLAKEANRLVLAIVVMPQQPLFQGVIAALASDPNTVSAINDSYVPILVDGDATREIGLLTSDLCSEIKTPVQLPLLIWMTPEGDPIAWIPVSDRDPKRVVELFNQSHAMVSQMWLENADYVIKNSGLDNANRRDRIAQRKNRKVMSDKPAEDVLLSLRQLASFYDSYTRSFDEAGGLFPSGAIDLLSIAAVHPGLPLDTRKRSMETTRDLLIDLMPSAMFDPLDGGLFSSRRGKTWSLPAFFRDGGTQARAAASLFNAYRSTGDKRALSNALGLIAYAEKSYTTPEGLFAIGFTEETEVVSWLWRVEDIEKELSAEDAAWWIKATGMKGLGNLPSEVDPQREFFRGNSLGMKMSVEEIAAELGQTREAFMPRYEMVRKTLLKARNARFGNLTPDLNSHAGVTFRMVSAYAAAFGATGDENYRQKAVDLLDRARAAFSDGPRLRLFSKDSPQPIGAGRAFLYGLALQAILDVAAITSDEKMSDWSENLATTAAELFTDSEYLKECPDDARIIDLAITDLVMLFEDSTAGLISFAECRLAERERPLVENFSMLATPLPTYTVERPLLHTDLLQATIARHYKVTIITGADLSPELKLAVERLPMRMIHRRPAKPQDAISAGSIKVIIGNAEPLVVNSAEALNSAISPTPAL